MQNRRPIPPRTSAAVDAHRAGHSSHIHPEDIPYWTDQQKKYPNPLAVADGLDYPGEPSRMPTSARRYYRTDGSQVIEGGNRQLIIHDEKPPRQRRRIHWAFVFWIGALAMLAFYLLYTWGTTWWTQHQLDATYGMPRTFQTDQVVGIDDSVDHPSHFIFENLRGRVLVIFLPGGDASRAKMYIGPQIFSENADAIPVTGEFKDVGNGKIDMLVHIGDQTIIYLNTGSDFKPQS